MSQRLYRILDRKPHPVLQEVELVRMCAGWRYYRCPETGLEWHVNGPAWCFDTPIDAWTGWFDSLMFELTFTAIPDVNLRKRNSFSELERLICCAREALDEVLRLRREARIERDWVEPKT